MLMSARAGFAGVFAAAFLALSVFPALAADKAYQNAELDEAAIKLEAQIKNDAGDVTKPLAQLRRDADAAFQKNDFRSGMVVLGQIIAAGARRQRELAAACRAPSSRSVRATTASARRCSSAPAPPPTSPISAPANRDEEADALTDRRPQLRRPQDLAAGARCAAAVARTARDRRRRARYTRRCATITASACSTIPSMPMRRRRAPASSSPRRCRASAPTSRRSSRSPAWTSRRSPPTTSSFASKASSTASATA